VNPRYPPVAERAAYRCEYCRAPEIVFNFPFEVEHIVPQAHGGPDDDDNLALACHSCNLFKSDSETGRDKEAQVEVALFHPRRDSWEDHFRVDAETTEIHGLTAVGRAAVQRLQINRSRQITARRRWIALDLFP
jgi:HNH endonuclease